MPQLLHDVESMEALVRRSEETYAANTEDKADPSKVLIRAQLAARHGLSRKALDMMCERALSRETQGSRLSDKQFVQGYIADSYAQLLQFRLMVLYTAWEIDKFNDYDEARIDRFIEAYIGIDHHKG